MLDVQCNIYDMAGNMLEWTTEYSDRANSAYRFPYVYRGGHGRDIGKNPSTRGFGRYNYSNVSINPAYNSSTETAVGFRPILYLM